MGIRRRLLLSFFALFAVVLAATAVISTILIAGSVEDRLDRQTRHLGRLFAAHPDFAASPQVLDWIRQAYEAESVEVGPAVPPAPSSFRAPAYAGAELVMTYSAEYVEREKRRAIAPFLGVAVAGAALVLVLGVLTARAIARPIERLSARAGDASGGEIPPVGGGAELDRLVGAMNRMIGQVRQAERLAVMGRMAASVAHEIRNPLSSMKMTVQMLREKTEDREPHDRMLREIERLELTAAELAGTSQPLRKERTALAGVVDDVLELLRPRLEHLSVAVERHFEPAPDVEVDVARFKSCVMNLVLNGAQAMPSGGPLSVGIAPRGGGVRLSVTDAGNGVPREVGSRVFEPFVTTKQDGVGMGLALTRRIVEEHGGTIGYDPAAKGTTFWIDLKGSEPARA